jgi:hypothetical protein
MIRNAASSELIKLQDIRRPPAMHLLSDAFPGPAGLQTFSDHMAVAAGSRWSRSKLDVIEHPEVSGRPFIWGPNGLRLNLYFECLEKNAILPNAMGQACRFCQLCSEAGCGAHSLGGGHAAGPISSDN